MELEGIFRAMESMILGNLVKVLIVIVKLRYNYLFLCFLFWNMHFWISRMRSTQFSWITDGRNSSFDPIKYFFSVVDAGHMLGFPQDRDCDPPQ
jgi:hypothetical protein